MPNLQIKLPLKEELIIPLEIKKYNFSFFSLPPSSKLTNVFTANHLLHVLKKANALELFKNMSFADKNILDKKLLKIFWYLHITTKTCFFSFSITTYTDPMFVDMPFFAFRKVYIPLKDFHDYKSIKKLIDGIEKTIHNSSRSFYSQYCYQKTFQMERVKLS